MNRRELLLGTAAAAVTAMLPPVALPAPGDGAFNANDCIWLSASRASASSTEMIGGALTTEEQRLLWERLGKYLAQEGALDKRDAMWLYFDEEYDG